MSIIYSILLFIHTINPMVKDIGLGVLCSMLTIEVGEMIGGEDITGHNVWDMIIKIGIPIVTGVIIPIVKNYISKRSSINKRKKNI